MTDNRTGRGLLRLPDQQIGAVFVALGAVFLPYALREPWRAFQSLRWPIVEAEVVHNAIEHRRRRRFEPVVRYRYSCEGRTYEGGRLAFSPSLDGSREEAAELLKLFPVGAGIPVRVCPTKNRLSVVKPGLDRGSWLPLAVSFVAIVGGWIVWNQP
jgi:hypothetical protein